MAAWRDDPVYAGLDLEDTFILAWTYDAAAGRLRFDVELSLLPVHSAFEAPAAGLYTCYRLGALTFDGVEGLEGFRAPAADQAIVDASGSADYGTFDQCEIARDGRATIAGEFGTFAFQCTAHGVEVGPVVAAA
jgi:hypothetical protein